jgi:uncharacterized cupredoxin-like copper-binding protein
VTVNMSDFAFAVTPGIVPAGDILFHIKNRGGIQHNFRIVDRDSPILLAGDATDLHVRLAPGEYDYECTVPGHAEAGMKGKLTVR